MADYSRLPGPVDDHWRWQELAACRGLQTTVFFHPSFERGPTRRRRDNAAKAVCQRCPVIAECRRYALEVQEPYGVWGGLTVEERTQLLRKQRRAKMVPGDVQRPESSPGTRSVVEPTP